MSEIRKFYDGIYKIMLRSDIITLNFQLDIINMKILSSIETVQLHAIFN